MIENQQTYYIDVNRQKRALTKDSARFSRATIQVFEGDTLNLKFYFKDYIQNKFVRLDTGEALIVSIATEDSIKETENKYLALAQDFDEIADDDGNYFYEGLLHLNTQEAIDILGTGSTAKGIFEVVVVRKDLGYQTTYQNELTILRSVAPATLRELIEPSAHIGTYATVKEMMEEIAQKHILDLKDGAPLEFDTLFELAHYAQKVRSHEIQVGDFCDYLDGKRLADQNLTVVSLGNIMMNESTYSVSHEPWRPRDVTASIIE